VARLIGLRRMAAHREPRAVAGPTATILSAAKIDQSLCPLGTSLDMTFYGPRG
jgi:hypothetical protein